MALSILEYAAYFWVAVQLHITFKEELDSLKLITYFRGMCNKS